jgi:hypothetical protein
VTAGGGAAEIRLGFEGVGPLHQGYFSRERLVLALGEALAPCGEGPHEVLVSFDSERRIGRIELVVQPHVFGCLPARHAEGWDLSPLTPVGRAVAAYRDGVAAETDYRVAAFRGGIRYLRGPRLCALEMGGQYPPDGSTWSRCAKLAGIEVCGAGDREEGLLLLELGPAHEDYLSACFSP